MEKNCIVLPAVDAQKGKKVLKELNSWDGTRRLMAIEGTSLAAIPITTQHYDPDRLLDLVREKIYAHIDIQEMSLPTAKKLLVRTPQKLLTDALMRLFQERGRGLGEGLRREIPGHWEKHGDLVLLPDTAFVSEDWKMFGDTLWQTVCRSLQCQRLARKTIVTRDGYRTPQVVLLYGEDGWVHHIDNGIRYTYDVTKCMFSSGNITEKLRVSKLDCTGEVVVDLYAGIGYFSLPYLVYTGVKHLHACEWNPDAVEALRRNLELNGVTDRCTVHAGDNRQVCPRNVADRVNLGLIPSSEPGWRTACMALKSETGGILHIHGNVNTRKGCGENLIGESVRINDHISDNDCETLCRRTEDLAHQVSSRNDVTKEENLGLSSTNEELPNRIPEVEKSLHNCKLQTAIDTNFEEKEKGSEASNKSKWMPWAFDVSGQIRNILIEVHESEWDTTILHIEHVKSYAPHVDHVVLDLKCNPLKH